MNPLIALAELVASLDPDGSVPRETLEAMVELAKEALKEASRQPCLPRDLKDYVETR